MKLNTYFKKFLNPSIWKHPIVLTASVLMFIIGVAYITVKIPNSNSQSIDAKYFWTAGTIWLKGQNPYDIEIFRDVHEEIFFSKEGLQFAYPPSWGPLAMTFALFPFEPADWLWRITNYLSLTGIFLMTVLFLKKEKLADWKDGRVWLGGAYIYTLQAVAQVLDMGQTAIICSLGLILLLYGIRNKNIYLSTFGFYLLSLKPHLALIPLSFLFFTRYYSVFFWGIFVVILASFLAMIRGGFFTTISGFISNLFFFTTYSKNVVSVNLPDKLTGLINLSYYLGLNLSMLVLVIPALIFTLIVSFFASRYYANSMTKIRKTQVNSDILTGEFIISIFILLVALTSFFMPLHYYDFTIYAPLMMMSLYLPWRSSICLLPGLLLGFRPENISGLLGLFDGQILASLAALILVIGASINLIGNFRYINPEL